MLCVSVQEPASEFGAHAVHVVGYMIVANTKSVGMVISIATMT